MSKEKSDVLRLKYSEMFYSLQGEGLFVGTPSVFLRSFGCNFRCKMFGIDYHVSPGIKRNPEVSKIINSPEFSDIKKFKDLPLVHTGCDSYASVYPEFKHLMKNETPEKIARQLVELTPNKKWYQDNKQDIHLILTGGEPMLWQKHWIELLKLPNMKDLRNLTIETNGTQNLDKDFYDFLRYQANFVTTWSCSPKLSASGENRKNAIKPDVVKQYMKVYGSNIYLKFVVSSVKDLDEVAEVVLLYNQAGVYCPVYIMPTGGCIQEYEKNEKTVAEYATADGWRFSPRLHLRLYGNEWGT